MSDNPTSPSHPDRNVRYISINVISPESSPVEASAEVETGIGEFPELIEQIGSQPLPAEKYRLPIEENQMEVRYVVTFSKYYY